MPDAKDAVPVRVTLSKPKFGWVSMTLSAGDAEAVVDLSHVYDPFEDLVGLATQAAGGLQGAIQIDEEGRDRSIWLTVEPGSFLGRLRVFRTGEDGLPCGMEIDATVDALQFAFAFHTAFADLAADYDPVHWRPDHDYEAVDPPRTLAKIDTWLLTTSLGAFGLSRTRNAHRWSRERYEAALGDAAVPMLPGTAFD